MLAAVIIEAAPLAVTHRGGRPAEKLYLDGMGMAGQSQGYVDAVVVAYIILPMGRIMGQKHLGQTVGQRRI